ncbi:MAG: Ig-like domain-containing protein [bacterium]
MKKIFGILIGVCMLGVFAVAIPAYATTGFVNSPIWISPDKPSEGQNVTLSAVFHNSETETISGSILFYDENTLLSEKPITLRPDEVATITTSFTISAGAHIFSAKTKNLSQVSSTGTLEVLSVPVATVELPPQFIPKSIVSTNNGNGVGDVTKVILKQVDKAQSAVLSSVPPATKKQISTTANTVDNWRSDTADTFTKVRDNAKASLDQAKNPTKKVATKVAPKGPFTYLLYLLFSFLSFLFSSPVIFYLTGLLIVYFILRYLYLKIRNRNKKPSSSKKGSRSSSRDNHDE